MFFLNYRAVYVLDELLRLGKSGNDFHAVSKRVTRFAKWGVIICRNTAFGMTARVVASGGGSGWRVAAHFALPFLAQGRPLHEPLTGSSLLHESLWQLPWPGGGEGLPFSVLAPHRSVDPRHRPQSPQPPQNHRSSLWPLKSQR